MNFNFYISGTPNGYNQYPFDSKSVILQEFAKNNITESQLTVSRNEQLIYYAYHRKLHDQTNSYIGFCLVFNGIYCQSHKKIFDLFDMAFNDVKLTGELLKYVNGKFIYIIDKFIDKTHEIERIRLFFKHNIESDFRNDFVKIPNSFKIGNGKKYISIKESENEIITTISQFDTVHIKSTSVAAENLPVSTTKKNDDIIVIQKKDTGQQVFVELTENNVFSKSVNKLKIQKSFFGSKGYTANIINKVKTIKRKKFLYAMAAFFLSLFIITILGFVGKAILENKRESNNVELLKVAKHKNIDSIEDLHKLRKKEYNNRKEEDRINEEISKKKRIEKEKKEEKLRHEMLKKVEISEWNKAVSQDTEQSYQVYLDKFPHGEYSNQARNRKNKLYKENNTVSSDGYYEKEFIISVLKENKYSSSQSHKRFLAPSFLNQCQCINNGICDVYYCEPFDDYRILEYKYMGDYAIITIQAWHTKTEYRTLRRNIVKKWDQYYTYHVVKENMRFYIKPESCSSKILGASNLVDAYISKSVFFNEWKE